MQMLLGVQNSTMKHHHQSIVCCCSVYMDGAAEVDEPGYGPLRAWPGGLCVSRAIGDMDVGECIIAHPHIMQLQIPEEGARVVIASDGLWDCFSSRKVVKMARTKDTQQAGQHRQKPLPGNHLPSSIA